MSHSGRDASDDDAARLDDVPDGLGCAEVREELSEHRRDGSGSGETTDGEEDEATDGDDAASPAERNSDDQGSGVEIGKGSWSGPG